MRTHGVHMLGKIKDASERWLHVGETTRTGVSCWGCRGYMKKGSGVVLQYNYHNGRKEPMCFKCRPMPMLEAVR